MTVSFAVIPDPVLVAVKIYDVVAPGAAFGLLIVEELNPLVGLHK